jgi:hypothetical protein
MPMGLQLSSITIVIKVGKVGSLGRRGGGLAWRIQERYFASNLYFDHSVAQPNSRFRCDPIQPCVEQQSHRPCCWQLLDAVQAALLWSCGVPWSVHSNSVNSFANAINTIDSAACVQGKAIMYGHKIHVIWLETNLGDNQHDNSGECSNATDDTLKQYTGLFLNAHSIDK